MRALTTAEKARGLVRPVMTEYVHLTCQHVNTFDADTAETIARTPALYKKVWCAKCNRYRDVREFVWAGTSTLVEVR